MYNIHTCARIYGYLPNKICTRYNNHFHRNSKRNLHALLYIYIHHKPRYTSTRDMLFQFLILFTPALSSPLSYRTQLDDWRLKTTFPPCAHVLPSKVLQSTSEGIQTQNHYFRHSLHMPTLIFSFLSSFILLYITTLNLTIE